MTDHSPIAGQTGRAPLERDGQQWILDYLIQETGRVFHFQGEGRGGLPRSVRSHAMIPKHLGQRARKQEAFADIEAGLGHRASALDAYFQACQTYVAAQHPIFELSPEKRLLNAGVRRCYDRVRELAPYPLERVEVPWRGAVVTGNLHLDPAADAPAPLVLFVPGCDVTKEQWPHPHANQAHQRGMHVFSFDGPGQGEANLAGIRMTPDGYEDAARVVLDVLLARPEVDAGRLGVYATSFGTFWGLRIAATDPRVGAVAAIQASICETWIQADLESPRWKQLFAFLTQATSEAELDAVLAAMTMDGFMGRITAPTLLTVGEYDPRAPLDELYRLYDQLTAPAELWVMADQHHSLSVGGGPDWARASHGMAMDWIADRLAGHPVPRPGAVVRVDAGTNPNASDLPQQRHWFA